DGALLDLLEDRLASLVTLRAVGVTAAGLLGALRGKRETARVLLAGVDALPLATAPRIVHAAARSWLVADAAERGDWQHVAALGRGRGSYLRWPSLMGAIAQRLLGDLAGPSNV